jgi:non-ribosomal peptide synthetase component E (peptide arylation enzyme)
VVFFGTPDLLDRTTRLLGPVWAHGFGSTEQGAVATRLLPHQVDQRRERINSVGRPASPFLEIAVIDEQGQKLGAGQAGEIVARSAMSLGGYWDMPERTAQSFLPRGSRVRAGRRLAPGCSLIDHSGDVAHVQARKIPPEGPPLGDPRRR